MIIKNIIHRTPLWSTTLGGLIVLGLMLSSCLATRSIPKTIEDQEETTNEATSARRSNQNQRHRTLVKSGFQDQRVQTFNFDLPTGFDWLPDGHLVVLQKKGIVWIYNDFESSSDRHEALDLQDVMCDNSERGLMGIAIHPDFGVKNQFIYLYYTFKKHENCDENHLWGPVNRISRFVLSSPPNNNNTTTTQPLIIDRMSETVLLETPPLEYDHHNSGDLVFGKDGHLYATIGDGGSHQTFVSQDDSNLFGTIIRITDEGGIPQGNPYTYENGYVDSSRCLEGKTISTSPSAKCQEIYASGLRNPYRFAMDPNTPGDKVRFFINDVGQATWEEISEGGDDFAGANYGWPDREGPCENNKRDRCTPDPRFTEPIHYYIHQGSTCITGGAFVPDGVWPVEYDGAYLYADYVFEKIFIMTENGNSGCPTCIPPTSDKEVTLLTEFPRLLGLKFGPYRDTQALYYTSNSNGGELRRVSFVGSGNYSPEARIMASTATSIPAGQMINFDATQSTDPDGDTLTYQWHIITTTNNNNHDSGGHFSSTSGDSTTSTEGPQISFTFSNPGLYTVRVTVNDGRGGEDTSAVEISVGNKPIPSIDSIPEVGATFAVGDLFTLSGSATDEEDGVLPDSSLTWEVRQHHDTHFHPFLDPTKGNHIQLQSAPAPEDYDAATNSYLEVILTATDSDGLSNSINRIIQPKKVLLHFDTVPSGLELILDGLRITTPIYATSWENHALQVIAPPFQYATVATIDSNHTNNILVPHQWTSWSNGQPSQHDIAIEPSTDANTTPSFIAEFEIYIGTNAPSTSPTTDPDRIIGLLEAKREYLLSGEPKVFPKDNLILSQQRNGNLVLTRNGTVVWETGRDLSNGKYFTYINGGSNMITKRGTPDARGPTVFSTRGNNVDGDYFLGLNPDDTVSVYAGKSKNPGFQVWNSASGTVTKSPSVAPSTSQTPTFTQIPSANPTNASTSTISQSPSIAAVLPPSTVALVTSDPTSTISQSPSIAAILPPTTVAPVTSAPTSNISQSPSIAAVLPPTTVAPVTSAPTISQSPSIAAVLPPTSVAPVTSATPKPTTPSFYWIPISNDEYVSSDDPLPTASPALATPTTGTINASTTPVIQVTPPPHTGGATPVLHPPPTNTLTNGNGDGEDNDELSNPNVLIISPKTSSSSVCRHSCKNLRSTTYVTLAVGVSVVIGMGVPL